MALALMVKPRLWLGGEVSAQRDLPLLWWLMERVRRCAAHRPLLVWTDGLAAYIRAIRETFREPGQTGTGGRPRLRPWPNVLIAQVVKRYERRRVVETDAVLSLAHRHAWRRSAAGRKGMGSSIRRTWSGSTRRSGNASRLWRAAAGHWHAIP